MIDVIHVFALLFVLTTNVTMQHEKQNKHSETNCQCVQCVNTSLPPSAVVKMYFFLVPFSFCSSICNKNRVNFNIL